MLVDGNDDRGIDVGLFTKTGFDIHSIVSHVDDLPPGGGDPVFSRDCVEYEVQIPGDEPLLVLVNHFKSKRYGSQAANDKRRTAARSGRRSAVEIK